MHHNIHCSIVYNSQIIEANSMSIGRGMHKGDMIHIHNQVLAIEKNKIVPFAAAWMGLEIIMLSEVSLKE